jgi:hypothetical protein
MLRTASAIAAAAAACMTASERTQAQPITLIPIEVTTDAADIIPVYYYRRHYYPYRYHGHYYRYYYHGHYYPHRYYRYRRWHYY